MDIIIKTVAALVGTGLVCVLKMTYAYIKARLDHAAQENLDKFVTELVASAEQMYKQDDPSGVQRLDYVNQLLIENGYELTDAIRALIESKVYDLNQSATH